MTAIQNKIDEVNGPLPPTYQDVVFKCPNCHWTWKRPKTSSKQQQKQQEESSLPAKKAREPSGIEVFVAAWIGTSVGGARVLDLQEPAVGVRCSHCAFKLREQDLPKR